ncbi:MAG: hypothetical protein GVY35_18595 [Bacteroidetes bacterium]|jgi:hypothetical protein|nr:hypothetical protein [Bacteroidota bacterium]
MASDADNTRFMLYVADTAFLVGALTAPVLFGLGYVFDALMALSMAVAGAAYAVHRGQPWPGHALLTSWRRDEQQK